MNNNLKKLVTFCDGTWNWADQKTVDGRPCPTNVLKLFEATVPYDLNGNPQIVHNVEGVGIRWAERLRGGGFGYSISDNIKNASIASSSATMNLATKYFCLDLVVGHSLCGALQG